MPLRLRKTYEYHPCDLTRQHMRATVDEAIWGRKRVPQYYAILANSKNVKTVKTLLESHDALNKDIKIRNHVADRISTEDDRFMIPTIFEIVAPALGTTEVAFRDGCDPLPPALKDILQAAGEQCPTSLIIVSPVIIRPVLKLRPLQQAVSDALAVVSNVYPGVVDASLIANLISTINASFNIYQPMLLLPPNAFPHPSWSSVLGTFDNQADIGATFFSRLAAAMNTTHVALNGPIPALQKSSAVENILRSPTSLTPLHGDFGPSLPHFPLHEPSSADFDAAFWVCCRQNGIAQIWAPRYTMFSAGNVTEKARLLTLPSVLLAVNERNMQLTPSTSSAAGCAAVDMFAGIGYFAFSYAHAGIRTILCWDLNPWSIEGLRRGAAANKWNTRTFSCSESDMAARNQVDDTEIEAEDAVLASSARLLLFCESNVHAAARIRRIRTRLPPIRHVNCGMLPTIGAAWKGAVEAVDPWLGGWVHLHETVDERQMGIRSEEIVGDVEEYWKSLNRRFHEQDRHERIRLEHLERVKSTGPRLWHVVLDIWIPPRQDLEDR